MRPHAAISNTEMNSKIPIRLVDGRSNDDADSDGHGADQNGERHVLLLHDLFPKMVRGHLVHHEKCDHEHQNPEKRKRESIDDVTEREQIHLIFLRYSDGSYYTPSDRNRDCRGRILVCSSLG